MSVGRIRDELCPAGITDRDDGDGLGFRKIHKDDDPKWDGLERV